MHMQMQTPSIVAGDMMMPALDPGIEIFVRNKRPANLTAFRPERTVLYVHGATYPASTSFDLPLDGLSWMDYLAARGYDVYMLDVRGYGRSTRPPEMAETPDAHPPIVRSETAIRDIGAVVEFILKRRNIPRLNLIGWSWGTTTMATYTTQNPGKVERLVLYAPGWIRKTTPLVPVPPGPLGAWRATTRAQALTRWLTGVPEDKKSTLIPAGWFDQWADAAWADDPVGRQQDPPVIRAPNGVLADNADYWSLELFKAVQAFLDEGGGS
jgi:pimeloyl-ACP methyl ester carboxylesterase